VGYRGVSGFYDPAIPPFTFLRYDDRVCYRGVSGFLRPRDPPFAFLRHDDRVGYRGVSGFYDPAIHPLPFKPRWLRGLKIVRSILALFLDDTS